MLVYPQLTTGALSQFPIQRKRTLRTVTNVAADGSRVVYADPAGGTVEWRLAYTDLSDAEIAGLQAFHTAAEGSLNSFTFVDPAANLLLWSEDLTNQCWVLAPLLTVEAGVGYYTYPGSATDESYPELYVAPSYTKDKLTLGVSLYYASNYYRTGAWENYNSVSAKYDLGSGFLVSAELGRQGFGTTNPTQASPGVKLPDYVYGNVGVSYTYKSLVFDLHFHATTLSKQSCFLITGTGSASAGSNGCEPAVIGTLTWNAGLSDLKTALGEKR